MVPALPGDRSAGAWLPSPAVSGPPGTDGARAWGRGTAARTEELARQVARDAHAGQVDALGRPRFDHVCAVAERCRQRLGELGVVVGLLHDTVEKGFLTREELAAYGFDAAVLDLVDVLTQAPGEEARVYLERCAADPVGAIIKEADLVEKIDAGRAIDDDDARRHVERWTGRLRELRRQVERRRRAAADER